MRKSYSKIRHIQEANQRLERRVLSEKNWLSKIGDYFRGPESEEYDEEEERFVIKARALCFPMLVHEKYLIQ